MRQYTTPTSTSVPATANRTDAVVETAAHAATVAAVRDRARDLCAVWVIDDGDLDRAVAAIEALYR